MNNIKADFSIKDLENLSGIKAHTIRIWEKRYRLLSPSRSESNIRSYNIKNLQKLLNVAFLIDNGYKISKISKFKENKIPELVRELATNSSQKHFAINAFKIAMLNFDQTLFNSTYNNLLQENSFKEIFYTLFIALLNDIGLLWQTHSITPAHEHFISNLIKQKILINIEKIQNLQLLDKSKTFVLFLPLNEIHDIGLLFINYELVCKGYHCVYLGESVPIESLKDLNKLYKEITFISYFTVKPDAENFDTYIDKINQTIIRTTTNKFLFLGKQSNSNKENGLPKNIFRYQSISDLLKDL